MKNKKNKLLLDVKKYFNIDAFREPQEKVIKAILSKKDCFVLMPTGGGKSLCYQYPATKLEGLTIVVSPLVALMEDQVRNFKEKVGRKGGNLNKMVGMLHGQMKRRESCHTLKALISGDIKLLYLSPERLVNQKFLRIVEQLTISLLVVDEAHCISMYGYDFRPPYIKILSFIMRLQNRPIIAAFTATATDIVKRDIISLLQLKKAKTFNPSLDTKRYNLELKIKEVKIKKEKYDMVYDFISKHIDESGILYCGLINTVNDVADKLEKKGFSVSKYYGDLDDKEKKKAFIDFINGKTKIMVATNAFGMGIDKGDIRYVIHIDMPQNLESYRQEIGRAGRDGCSSECILYYSKDWINLLQKRIIEEKPEPKDDKTLFDFTKKLRIHRLEAMKEFCKNNFNKGSDEVNEELNLYFEDDTSNTEIQNMGEIIHQKIIKDLKKPQILFINNTKAAWMIRKRECSIGEEIEVYLDKKNESKSSFFLSEELDYFDLCISDAIYSIYNIGRRKFYLKNIIEILSGNENALLEAKMDKIIRARIERMMNINIRIDITKSKICSFIKIEGNSSILEGFFLPLKRVGTAYEIKTKPPLYRYAEQIGQLVQIPKRNLAIINEKKKSNLTDDMKHMPNSVENLMLRHYILWRILIVKNKNKQKMRISRTISLNSKDKRIKGIYTVLGIELPKTKSLEKRKINEIKDKINMILEYECKAGLISNYSFSQNFDSVEFSFSQPL